MTTGTVHMIHLEPRPWRPHTDITRHCTCGWVGAHHENHPPMSLEDHIATDLACHPWLREKEHGA